MLQSTFLPFPVPKWAGPAPAVSQQSAGSSGWLLHLGRNPADLSLPRAELPTVSSPGLYQGRAGPSAPLSPQLRLELH